MDACVCARVCWYVCVCVCWIQTSFSLNSVPVLQRSEPGNDGIAAKDEMPPQQIGPFIGRVS